MQVSHDEEPAIKAFRFYSLARRDFGGGEVEVTCREGAAGGRSARQMEELRALSADAHHQGTEASRLRALRRAAAVVRHKLKAIRADRMVTLTYAQNMTDPERLRHDWDLFRRRIKKVQGFEYIAVVERQKRGAFHIHLAVHGRQNYRVLRSIWRSIVGRGNVDVRNPFKERALRHRLCGYLCKYLGKAFAESGPGSHRYWCSKGIVVPDAEYVAEVFPTMYDAMNAAVRLGVSAAGHLREFVHYMHSASRTYCLSLTTRL